MVQGAGVDHCGGATLSGCAVPHRSPRGRRRAEPDAPTRTDFQRDRDRIVHSTAFRRLVYKTQVFVNHEGDLFRTRLTHSLEVAQLGRAIARSLRLNEDLVEAIALAHDLGHTPFGHAGQDALDECMRRHGEGFEHNLQSLRVVDSLEQRYPAFDGLNLCFETRAGILKRCSGAVAQVMLRHEPEGVARRFVDGHSPSLEAQLANLADEIAYNAHDVDDGVRSGLISLAQVAEIPLYQQHADEAAIEHPALPGQPKRWLAETLRRMLSAQVYDVIDATSARVRESGCGSLEEIYRAPPLVSFTPTMRAQSTALKRFLFSSLYRHPQVMVTTAAARRVVGALFEAYLACPAEMSADYVEQADRGEQPLVRTIADYIAGMTDRYASREHQRLTGEDVFAGLPGY